MKEVCPCDTGKAYQNCCLPFHNKSQIAPTAVALMRARYAAFVKSEIDFILDTIAASKRKDYDRKGVETWSKSTDWKSLEIVRTEKGAEADSQGEVEFIAYYREKDTVKKHHELANFIKDDGQWFFEDGKAASVKQVVREAPKVGRNDPCHCGSGKKFKKCHGLGA